MSTLTRIIITSIISILILSCNFSMNLGEGVDGNKNVVTEDRNISDDFSSIKVSQGLDLYITQSNDVSLSVEADENLHDLIMTKVENDVLSIYCTENIRRAASKKIMISISDISKFQHFSVSKRCPKHTHISRLFTNASASSQTGFSARFTTTPHQV